MSLPRSNNLDTLPVLGVILDVGCVLEALVNLRSLSTHGGGASFPERRWTLQLLRVGP